MSIWLIFSLLCFHYTANGLEDNSLLGLIEEPVREDLGPNIDHSGCICVPYYQCKDGEIITNGEGLIDIRMGDNINNKCEGVLDVCCKPPSEKTTTPRPFNPQCGVRNRQGTTLRIAFNKEDQSSTQYGEFPWHVAVLNEQYDESGNLLSVYSCGGSLIHEQVVLTTAHCVDKLNPSTIKVRAGSWDIQNSDEPYQEEYVAEVLIKEDYKPGFLFNDLALLFLKVPFKLSPEVNTICLPDNTHEFPEGYYCIATGWGKNRFGNEGNFQSILKKIELPLVSHAECARAMRSTRLGPFFRLHQSFTCAGGNPGEDTCQGDGGSALVCEDPDHQTYSQVGIVAWGIGCGGDGIPGVYVDVRKFTDWINNAIDSYFFM